MKTRQGSGFGVSGVQVQDPRPRPFWWMVRWFIHLELSFGFLEGGPCRPCRWKDSRREALESAGRVPHSLLLQQNPSRRPGGRWPRASLQPLHPLLIHCKPCISLASLLVSSILSPLGQFLLFFSNLGIAIAYLIPILRFLFSPSLLLLSSIVSICYICLE